PRRRPRRRVLSVPAVASSREMRATVPGEGGRRSKRGSASPPVAEGSAWGQEGMREIGSHGSGTGWKSRIF
ncbi:MAG: hypothetical protein P8Y94_06905, partial [Acidobacteriota bacterium]